MKKIKGREINYVFSVFDELMEALKALNPSLYANTMRRFEWKKIKENKRKGRVTLPFLYEKNLKKFQKIIDKSNTKCYNIDVIKRGDPQKRKENELWKTHLKLSLII